MGFKIYLISSLCSVLLLLQHPMAVPAPSSEQDYRQIANYVTTKFNKLAVENALASKSLLRNLLTYLKPLESKSTLMQENIQKITNFIEIVEQYEASPAPQQTMPLDYFAKIDIISAIDLYYILEYNTSPENKTPADYEFIQESLKRSNYASFKREMLQRFKTFKTDAVKLFDDYYKLPHVESKDHKDYEPFQKFKNEPDLEKSYKMMLFGSQGI